jgi:hypothetical protein
MRTAQETIFDTAQQGEATELLDGLIRTHERLKSKVELLYTSLDITPTLPELSGVNPDFVRTLLLARDLKMNIRKRAVGSFFEWDRLDRAVGGRHQTLGKYAYIVYTTCSLTCLIIGTKLHQQTRKAIMKRKPALMASIRKFNEYCSLLADLHNPSWAVSLPRPLPTELAELRDNSDLMEDVWLSPTSNGVPQWLEDQGVREGIRAMLKVDRCAEELRRLEREAQNLRDWFGHEFATLELALCTPACTSFVI